MFFLSRKIAASLLRCSLNIILSLLEIKFFILMISFFFISIIIRPTNIILIIVISPSIRILLYSSRQFSYFVQLYSKGFLNFQTIKKQDPNYSLSLQASGSCCFVFSPAKHPLNLYGSYSPQLAAGSFISKSLSLNHFPVIQHPFP